MSTETEAAAVPEDLKSAQAPAFNVDSLKASMDAARKFEKSDGAFIEQKPETKVVTTESRTESGTDTEQPEARVEPKTKSESGIKAMRSELEARGEKLKTLEQQLADFEGTRKERDELKSRIESLEAERDRLKKVESVAALEQSEEFQNKYNKGIENSYKRLAELSEYAGIHPDALQLALSKTGRDRVEAMEEILADAGRYLSEDIVTEIKTIDRLSEEKNRELSNAENALKERMAEREHQSRRMTEEQTKARMNAWKQVNERLSGELGLGEDIVSAANEFYTKNTDAGKAAEITIKGHAYDALSAKVAELTAELSKYQRQTPGVRAGVRSSDIAPDEKLSVADRINKQLQDMGFGRR